MMPAVLIKIITYFPQKISKLGFEGLNIPDESIFQIRKENITTSVQTKCPIVVRLTVYFTRENLRFALAACV